MFNYSRKYNFFNEELLSPLDIIGQSDNSKVLIGNQINCTLESIGSDIKFQDIYKIICDNENIKNGIHYIENLLNEELNLTNNETKIKNLNERAVIVSQQLHKVLNTDLGFKDDKSFIFLDYGCGDGQVSLELKKKLKNSTPVLADVFNFTCKDVKDYNFYQINPYEIQDFENEILRNETLPENKFDVIFILTVLHHSDMPIQTFNSAYNLVKNGGHIIVLESVIGITLKELIENRENNILQKINIELEEVNQYLQYISLSKNEQIFYGVFLDWFYNRVIHKGVNVPYNFTSVDKWTTFFQNFEGIQQEKVYYEGFDQPLVKEFHTIHVLKKNINGN